MKFPLRKKTESPAVEQTPEDISVELRELQKQILQICDCRFKLTLFNGQLFRLREIKADRRKIDDVLKKISKYEKQFSEYQKLTARYAELNKKFHELNGDPLPEAKPYPAPPVKPQIRERVINLKYRVKMSQNMGVIR